MQNFELQFWDVGGCVGYLLSSKSILKVVSQMVRLCDYATVLFSYIHIGFLTFVALLKNTFSDGTPCTYVVMYTQIIKLLHLGMEGCRNWGCNGDGLDHSFWIPKYDTQPYFQRLSHSLRIFWPCACVIPDNEKGGKVKYYNLSF